MVVLAADRLNQPDLTDRSPAVRGGRQTEKAKLPQGTKTRRREPAAALPTKSPLPTKSTDQSRSTIANFSLRYLGVHLNEAVIPEMRVIATALSRGLSGDLPWATDAKELSRLKCERDATFARVAVRLQGTLRGPLTQLMTNLEGASLAATQDPAHVADRAAARVALSEPSDLLRSSVEVQYTTHLLNNLSLLVEEIAERFAALKDPRRSIDLETGQTLMLCIKELSTLIGQLRPKNSDRELGKNARELPTSLPPSAKTRSLATKVATPATTEQSTPTSTTDLAPRSERLRPKASSAARPVASSAVVPSATQVATPLPEEKTPPAAPRPRARPIPCSEIPSIPVVTVSSSRPSPRSTASEIPAPTIAAVESGKAEEVTAVKDSLPVGIAKPLGAERKTPEELAPPTPTEPPAPRAQSLLAPPVESRIVVATQPKVLEAPTPKEPLSPDQVRGWITRLAPIKDKIINGSSKPSPNPSVRDISSYVSAEKQQMRAEKIAALSNLRERALRSHPEESVEQRGARGLLVGVLDLVTEELSLEKQPLLFDLNELQPSL